MFEALKQKIKIDAMLDCPMTFKTTPEERKELLVKAKILTEDGNYHPDFFSEETINKEKWRKK
jgi:hypothetical protein